MAYSIVSDGLALAKSITLTPSTTLEEASTALMKSFLSECCRLQSPSRRTLFFFHNFSRFDSFFITQHCVQDASIDIRTINRENTTYKAIVSTNGSELEFRDSYLLLPISLQAISEHFCSTHSKQVFDFAKLTADTLHSKELIVQVEKYCLYDALALREGFLRYLTTIQGQLQYDPLAALSLPSLALKLFRAKHYDDLQQPIELLSENKDSFLRLSYKGGIVEVYKPHLINGYHYDINSLYPYVMQACDMPTGAGTWVSRVEDLQGFFGFVKADIHCPPLHKPTLPHYDPQRGLISPVGSWCGVYFSEELKDAQRWGYTIRCRQGIAYQRGQPFRDFISTVYQHRISCDKGSPLNMAMKLLMNSLYGRFGMKTAYLETRILDEQAFNDCAKHYDVQDWHQEGAKYIVKVAKSKNIHNLQLLLEDGQLSLSEYEKEVQSSATHRPRSSVHISSAITAYARMHMNQFKCDERLDVHYTDTDSIYCQHPLPADMVDERQLGKFKQEAAVAEGFFLAPKIYYIEDGQGAVKMACKGMNSKELVKDDYLQCYHSSSSFVKSVSYNFLRNYRTFAVTAQTRKISIEPKLLKRDKVFDADGLWVDTSPLTLEE